MNISFFFPVVFVKKDEEAVVERFGEFHRLLGPGVHFLIPLFEKLHGIDSPDPKNFHGPQKLINNGKIPICEQKLLLPKDDRVFYTKSKNTLKVKAETVYKITDPYKAVYEVAYLFDAINQLVCGILQKRILETELDENSTPEQETEMLKSILEQAVETCDNYTVNWGVKILRIKVLQVVDPKGIRHNF